MLNEEAIMRTTDMYNKYYKPSSIESIVIDSITIKNILNICDNTQHMEFRYEWYDDKDDPETNTWVDVEGEGYGWLWINKPEEEWHSLLRDQLLDFIDKKNIELNEKVIVAAYDNKIVYHFIERETLLRDVIFTFSDEEIHY
jgi:hypothetical protein